MVWFNCITAFRSNLDDAIRRGVGRHAQSPIMHPQLAALIGQLEAVTARASELGAALDDAAFHARPPSAGWSAAECIAHLNLTTVALLPRLDSALATGRPGFPDTRRYRRGVGVASRLVIGAARPPAIPHPADIRAKERRSQGCHSRRVRAAPR